MGSVPFYRQPAIRYKWLICEAEWIRPGHDDSPICSWYAMWGTSCFASDWLFIEPIGPFSTQSHA